MPPVRHHRAGLIALAPLTAPHPAMVPGAPAARGAQEPGGGWAPDRDEARRLLQEELAGRQYAEAGPHPVLQWLGEVVAGLAEWIGSLGGGAPALPGWMLLVLVVVVAVVVLLMVRPHANAAGRSRRDAAVIADRTLSPEDHRRVAAAATAAGDHDRALAGWFRALVRQAEVRTVLDTRPGRTATEAAHALGAAYPAEREVLHRAAAAFNAVLYGDRPATVTQAEAVRVLDTRLRGSPAASASGHDGHDGHDGRGTASLVAPR